MKKIELLSYDYLKAMDEQGLLDYIMHLESYIYYQHGIITEAWKSLFGKDLDDVIRRKQ